MWLELLIDRAVELGVGGDQFTDTVESVVLLTTSLTPVHYMCFVWYSNFRTLRSERTVWIMQVTSLRHKTIARASVVLHGLHTDCLCNMLLGLYRCDCKHCDRAANHIRAGVKVGRPLGRFLRSTPADCGDRGCGDVD